ncbi:MAG: precorrin-6y methyltransferase [Myxococcaceae bacterium]|nr:precorrin-6y methyltransferase [Myxococcaceae bacterium]
MSVEAQSTDKAARAPWLSIVGLGVDGVAGLPLASQRAIQQAELVVGAPRQLALVESLICGQTLRWPSPLSEGILQVLARRGQPTCVLGSGDPFFYGIGATLAPSLSRGEFVCYPLPSSLSLAAARLGWPLQDTEIVSLHGRDLHAVIRYLQPGRRVLSLSWDRQTPGQLAALLCARGFGQSTLHVLEALGGPSEAVRTRRADSFDLTDIDDLNLVGLELCASPGALVIPCRGSLPDEAFEHDGQLTKQDVRAITLSALSPRPGALLWDVGAGAGSIGIEWTLAHPACRAIAIERERPRCERIERNARALGAPTLQVIEAAAPGGLEALPTPDAVFIGGGAGDPALFAACWARLRAGGRLVVNSVSLETEALLVSLHALHGGELRRLSIDSAVPLGSMRGWRPAMPVVQWRVSKPVSTT